MGLMSGTSLDGVDAALVAIADPYTVELLAFHHHPFESDDRAAMLRVITEGNVRDIALLHAILGEVFGRAAEAVMEQYGVSRSEVSFVACHGQTVWHEPGRATLQLGNPAVIAEVLGIRVVSDFRSRDVAAGGQGAPLVPIADVMLFGSSEGGRVLLNIGGMANFTWVPQRGVPRGVVACDTGPGVAVIDAVTRLVDPTTRFDENGVRARRGVAVTEVVDELLTHPWFRQPPPKSTGRELFGEVYARELVTAVRDAHPPATDDDCVATATQLTVESIVRHLIEWIPADPDADLVISGGGARNPTLVAALQSRSARPIRPFDDLFFDGDAKEAVAFAYLGWLTLHGRTGNVPAATGANGPRVLGAITPAGPSET